MDIQFSDVLRFYVGMVMLWVIAGIFAGVFYATTRPTATDPLPPAIKFVRWLALWFSVISFVMVVFILATLTFRWLTI